MKTIKAWSINVVWSDKEIQDVSYQVPEHIVSKLCRWLDSLEKEVNADEPTKEDEE